MQGAPDPETDRQRERRRGGRERSRGREMKKKSEKKGGRGERSIQCATVFFKKLLGRVQSPPAFSTWAGNLL